MAARSRGARGDHRVGVGVDAVDTVFGDTDSRRDRLVLLRSLSRGPTSPRSYTPTAPTHLPDSVASANWGGPSTGSSTASRPPQVVFVDELAVVPRHRGMLEVWVDPDSPYFKPELGEKRELILDCQSGRRSALATATLVGRGARPCPTSRADSVPGAGRPAGRRMPSTVLSRRPQTGPSAVALGVVLDVWLPDPTAAGYPLG